MKEVNPYLNFNGSTRRAMTFYNECFGAKLDIMPMPDAQGQPSTDPNSRVMHACISRNGQSILMASDTMPSHTLQPGNNMHVSIQCESVAEIERLFAALSHGGVVKVPLADTFWGARFGMLTDQFGIQWMLNCQLPPARS